MWSCELVSCFTRGLLIAISLDTNWFYLAFCAKNEFTGKKSSVLVCKNEPEHLSIMKSKKTRV